MPIAVPKKKGKQLAIQELTADQLEENRLVKDFRRRMDHGAAAGSERQLESGVAADYDEDGDGERLDRGDDFTCVQAARESEGEQAGE